MLYRSFICLTAFVLLLMAACAPPIELSTSWSNKTATVKNSPNVMVMVLGKDLATRQSIESYIVSYLQKQGYNSIMSLDIFKPDIKKYDSLTFVNLLRQYNIDLLLTNAVADIKETQRYVPGTTEQVPVATYPVESYPYYNGGYYNYYDYRTTYYQTVYETKTTPGYTVTDTEVLIESNLYDVKSTELLWIGQSRSYTKDPSSELFDEFAKIVVNDIIKNNLLHK
jgi:hypothetical protein